MKGRVGPLTLGVLLDCTSWTVGFDVRWPHQQPGDPLGQRAGVVGHLGPVKLCIYGTRRPR